MVSSCLYIFSASRFERAICGLWAMMRSKRSHTGGCQVRPLTQSRNHPSTSQQPAWAHPPFTTSEFPFCNILASALGWPRTLSHADPYWALGLLRSRVMHEGRIENWKLRRPVIILPPLTFPSKVRGPCIMRFLRNFLEILKTAPQCGLLGPNTGGFALGRVL